MFEKEIESVIETCESEVPVRLATRKVVLVCPEKLSQHLESLAHIRRSHFPTNNRHGRNDATLLHNLAISQI